MDHDEPPHPPPRRKFKPKPQAARKPRPTAASRPEVNDGDEEAVQAELIMRQFQETVGRRVPKVEKKASVQVAFGPGDPSSLSIREFGARKDRTSGTSGGSGLKYSSSHDEQIITSSMAKEDGTNACSLDAIDASGLKSKKHYIEPWDYRHTYYPTTLPWRRPYSGDPEILDEAEFGEAARNLEYDENTIKPASDLGLLEECEKERMLLFKLPTKLPLARRSVSAKGKEKAESSKPPERSAALKKGCSLEEIPEGLMGKMLVYKSGKLELKLGDVLYDVSPGSDCTFAQYVAAINTADKHCCVLGELDKLAVVTPDVDSSLTSVIDLS